jgi:hypothetical protein
LKFAIKQTMKVASGSRNAAKLHILSMRQSRKCVNRYSKAGTSCFRITSSMSKRASIHRIEKDADYIAGRILVAGSVKEKIIKELALFGITKETLFCDSIDVVCESIKGKFEQKVRGRINGN